MKITSIKQQEKRKDRYSVFVDSKYSFSLSESALLESKLTSGQELSDEDLKHFKKLSADDKAYGNVLRWAAMRSRSEGEFQDYFQRKNIEEPVAKQILNKLRNIGLVDDEAFARAWVEGHRLLKPTSNRRLIQELKQKRVSEEIIRSTLDKDQVDEREVLRELVAKKRQQNKYANEPLKLMQYLARQGFGYDDIKTVLREESGEDSNR